MKELHYKYLAHSPKIFGIFYLYNPSYVSDTYGTFFSHFIPKKSVFLFFPPVCYMPCLSFFFLINGNRITLHYVYVVVSRRLMPSDALQPEGLLYKPWSLVFPTCTVKCLHQRL